MPPTADTTRHEPSWRWAWPLLILAVGLWAYHNSFQAPFLLDDEPFILKNPHIRSLWPLDGPFQLPPRADSSWRPVLTFSLALNYAWSGLAVWSYHLVNLAIHLLAALVLFGVVRRTLCGERLRAHCGAASPWLALAVALIWVAHPLQTQSVTYVIQRGESLAGLCYLLTLYGAIRARASAHPHRWLAASILSCALGMGAKPVMATAPIMVMLYDWIFLSRSWKELFRTRGALYVALASTWVILAVTLLKTPSTVRPTSGFAMPDAGPLAYLLTQPGVILHDLKLALWPHPLCFDYGWPIAQRASEIMIPALVVAAMLALAIWAVRRRSPIGFLAAWVFGILAPTSSLIPLADPAVEYRMYLPLAGLVTGLALVVWELASHLRVSQALRRRVMAGAAAAVVVVLGQMTILRNAEYRSAVSIWQDTVARRPQNARAHSNLGVALAQAGRLDESLAHFSTAWHLRPEFAEARYNAGFALMQSGHPAEAIPHLSEAVRASAGDAEMRHALAQALAESGRTDEALAQFRQTLTVNPSLPEAHYNLGVVLVSAGRLEEAAAQFSEALKLRPDDAKAQHNLWLALAKQEPVGSD